MLVQLMGLKWFQAISWTNIDPVPKYKCFSPCFNELICLSLHPWTSWSQYSFTDLTLKQLDYLFFQNVILFSNMIHYKCSILNKTGPTHWILYQHCMWILVAWCFITRALVATVLRMCLCISSCLGANIIGVWQHLTTLQMSFFQGLEFILVAMVADLKNDLCQKLDGKSA